MPFVKFSITILVMLALLSPGLAASGFENSGIGTQARGMAGAFRAVADDWTAAYYNPAGYAYIYDNQLGANLALLHYRNELVPDYKLGGVYETGIFNDRTDYNRHEILSNPAGGIAFRVPIWGEMVTGFSIYQPFDYNIFWTLYDLPLAYNDSLSMPLDQFTNNLDVVAFQFTAAREFMEEKMSLGIGLQLLRADLLFNNLMFRENYLDGEAAVRPWDRITQRNHVDGSGWGFGLRGGMLWKANEKLNVAVTASLPFDITIKGDAKLVYYMPKIPTLILSDGTYAPGTLENLFVAGGEISDSAAFETKLQLPPSMAIGLAYKLTEKLTVSLDAEYTLWSHFEGFEFMYTDHSGLPNLVVADADAYDYFTTDITYPIEYDNAGKVALGARYNYTPWLTLLAGLSADQSATRTSSHVTPQFIDTGDKYSYCGGVVVHYDRWDFSLAGTYTNYPDLNVADLVDSNDDGLYDTFPGQYKASTYETVLSFNYRF